MFSRKDLIKLMVPLIIEQILAVAVGMLDVLMVAAAGEAAVSGVASVDAIGQLLIFILTALATGGAVVISQYLGRNDHKNAGIAANQLIIVTLIAGLFFMMLSVLGNHLILRIILGDIGREVMDNARIYFYITALSFPFLAVYNGCTAIYRSMGNSKVSMIVSVIMNAMNIAGNAAFVYGFQMGAAGVGLSTLISRIAAAIIMIVIVRNEKNVVHIDKKLKLGYQPRMIQNILRIGIPNGLENGMFQFGKVIIQRLIASLGTVAIAANAIGANVAGIQILPGVAIGVGLITVVGQCVGAGEYEQAKKYTRQLVLAAYILIGIFGLGTIVLSGALVGLYGLSGEVSVMAVKIIIWHSVTAILFWPLSFTLPNVLRAAGDARFTMAVSVTSMWLCRIVLAYIFVRVFNTDVFGVWMAMTVDWVFRLLLFAWRFISGKWIKQKSS